MHSTNTSLPEVKRMQRSKDISNFVWLLVQCTCDCKDKMKLHIWPWPGPFPVSGSRPKCSFMRNLRSFPANTPDRMVRPSASETSTKVWTSSKRRHTSESRLPRRERSLMLADPQITTLSSAIKSWKNCLVRSIVFPSSFTISSTVAVKKEWVRMFFTSDAY